MLTNTDPSNAAAVTPDVALADSANVSICFSSQIRYQNAFPIMMVDTAVSHD